MENRGYNSTTVNEYFAWLEKNIKSDSLLYKTVHTYLNAERTNEENKELFLSVVMRTQGKRPEMLSEALLSLTAQSNTDFELLLMGHNLSENQREVVTTILEEMPKWMVEKTRFIPVQGGTRTTPLNKGFEAAKGKYIAVLDDDDLVFDNWVETFYELSKTDDGKILHAYSVIQDWEVVGNLLPNTPRAAGSPKNTFCRDFKLLDELTINYCPLCTLAFPAYAFHEWGIHFDEKLTTTEDWDFMMRTSFLTGVADSSEVTFLYRNWLNAENSASVHNKQEWNSNYRYIVKRFVRTPFVLPSGTLHGVIDRNLPVDTEEDVQVECEGVNESSFILIASEMFYDDGSGFDESRKLIGMEIADNNGFNFCFKPKPEGCKNVSAIRFDPVQYGFASVRDLLICVVDEDDKSEYYTFQDVQSNGCADENKLLFLRGDPQIVLYLSHPINIKEVLIKCKIRDSLSDEEVDTYVWKEARKQTIGYRVARKCYRLLKRIRNKIRLLR